jgi:hypothetical protein
MPMPQSLSSGARRLAAMLFALALALAMLAPVLAQSATPAASPAASPVSIGDPVAAASAWLVSQQLEDGSFPGFSGTADAGTTADSLIALAAASAEGVDVADAIDRAAAYLDANGADYANKGVGAAAKLVIALEAAGGDVSKFTGVDLLATVTKAPADANGLYGAGVFDHAYVILALAAAGESVPQTAIDAFAKTQIADGSWGFDGKTTAGNGDTNTTALAIQALVAAGQAQNPIVAKGLAFLKANQTAAGNFPYQGGPAAPGDANSTALVVQAIVAAGQDPASAAWNNASAALLAFQNADGAFRYQTSPPDDNLFATVQSLPAVAGYDLGSLATGAEDATPVAA